VTELAGGRRAATPASIVVRPDAGEIFRETGALERVVAALGNNVVAQILGVSASQPSRWRSGKERMRADHRRQVSDLDHVLDRLLLELYPEQAGVWLTSPNPHLGGARPVDALRVRGAGPVLNAVDALGTGAFA
jgi:uncharacterized protein (DUF2384 family)